MSTPTTQKPPAEMDARERCLFIDGLTPKGGLYTDTQREVHPNANSSWQVSPDPFWMPSQVIKHFEDLGRHLHRFYHAANQLYWQSFRGIQPAWAAAYLDIGKPAAVNGRIIGEVSGLECGIPYYLVCRAYNSQGVESDNSSQTELTIAAPEAGPTTGFRVVK